MIHHADVIAKGLSEYTYSVGARRLDLGTESFSYGQVGLLAFHRHGFTDRLTAGARLELLATRPVQDGFAVIQVPGLPDVRGFLNNHEIGRTDSRGNLVLPGLLPYYGNRISIADTDLPLDRTVAEVERTIAPSYRGGALVRFEAKVARFFRGRVVVERGGKRVTPAYGEISIRMAAGELTSPLGKDGEFELSDLPPGKHASRVEYADGACTFEIVAPRSERVITDLGELRCVQ